MSNVFKDKNVPISQGDCAYESFFDFLQNFVKNLKIFYKPSILDVRVIKIQ